MGYETLIYEKRECVGIVTLNRPDRLNALSFKLKEEVSALFDEMEKDDEVRVVMRNNRQADLGDRVEEGDRIAYLPAVAGG